MRVYKTSYDSILADHLLLRSWALALSHDTARLLISDTSLGLETYSNIFIELMASLLLVSSGLHASGYTVSLALLRTSILSDRSSSHESKRCLGLSCWYFNRWWGYRIWFWSSTRDHRSPRWMLCTLLQSHSLPKAKALDCTFVCSSLPLLSPPKGI